MKDNIWRNWSRSVRCEPEKLEKPDSIDEVKDIVTEASSNDEVVRVAGAGHSFTRVVENNDVIVSLDEYTGIDSVDEENESAWIKAGTTLGELSEELDAEGLAMENLGDIDKQSLAGATSTGTHGTGIDFGVIATQVTGVEFVDGTGEVVKVASDDEDLLRCAQVSLGALGLITRVELDLEPQYNLNLVKEKMDLEETLENLESLREKHRNFEFFWFPHTEKAILKKIDKTDEEPRFPASSIDEVVENIAWEGLCKMGTLVPGTSKYMSTLAAASITKEDVVAPSHKIYTTKRDVRFNEMEYGVPVDEAPDVFSEIKNIAEEIGDVQFPIEFRYVKGDDIPISPAYGRDTAFIAIHKYYKKPFHDYFRKCEKVFREHDGRPHWGKMHFLDDIELRELYPKWELFQETRREHDPDGVYMNDYLEELFGE